MKIEQLLALLENNSRLEVRDLADILMESEDSVQNVMSDLEKDKIICGYHTIINWDKTCKEKVMAFIEVGATPEREYGYDRIAKNICRFPEVESMYLMSGKSEFFCIVNGRSMQEIANFVGSKLACVEQVKSTATLFVMKQYKSSGVIFDEEEAIEERLIVTP